MFREFINELVKNQYEVVEVYECKDTGFMKAQVKLAGRHIIEKPIYEIVSDFKLLEGFNKQTIRSLTYLATVEKLKPEYSITAQRLTSQSDDYTFEIKSKSTRSLSELDLDRLIRNKQLISQFSPIDANRIGYLAGLKEAALDYKLNLPTKA